MLSMFGSANFDNRSLELNDELNVAVANRDLAARLTAGLRAGSPPRHSGSTSTHGGSGRCSRRRASTSGATSGRCSEVGSAIRAPGRRRARGSRGRSDPSPTSAPSARPRRHDPDPDPGLRSLDGPRSLRSVSDRLPARRRRPHGAVQLAVRAAAGRHVRAAHRGHRHRALVLGHGRGHRRRPALAGARLGRGAGRRRTARARTSSRSGSTAIARGPSSWCRQRRAYYCYCTPARDPGEARRGGSGRRRLDLRPHLLRA